MRVVDFIAEPASLLRRADCVVTMGGYNCVCEALCSGKPALVVPRVKPRVEQWIRARRFGEMGLLDVLHPDEASPEAISRWLHGCGSEASASPRMDVDFGGLERLPGLMAELLRHDVGRRADVSAAPHGAGVAEKAGHSQPRHAPKESAAHVAR